MAPARMVVQPLIVACLVLALSGCTSNSTSVTGPSPIVEPSAPAAAPSVSGTWAGTYSVVECARAEGSLSHMCTSVGAAYPFTLELTQQGQVVTGRYALADIWVDLTPTAISDQNVTLTGAGRIDSAGVRVNVTWSVSVGRPSLRGTAVMEWTADAGGDATLRATVAGLALLPSS